MVTTLERLWAAWRRYPGAAEPRVMRLRDFRVEGLLAWMGEGLGAPAPVVDVGPTCHEVPTWLRPAPDLAVTRRGPTRVVGADGCILKLATGVLGLDEHTWAEETGEGRSVREVIARLLEQAAARLGEGAEWLGNAKQSY